MQQVRGLAVVFIFLCHIGITTGATANSAGSKGDKELGEYLSAQCVSCHQVTGQHTGAVPAIIAWPDDQFIAVMMSYKRHERENQIMQMQAGRLSEEEIAALAAYFGALPNQPKVK